MVKKIFFDESLSFASVDENCLDEFFCNVLAKVNCEKLSFLFAKNPEIIGAIIKYYNYNSFGNVVFTKIIFYFL
jgi:hypothetical protein